MNNIHIPLVRGNPYEDFLHLLPIIYTYLCIHTWFLMKLRDSKVKVKIAQLCPTLCNLMDSTVHWILLARILKWVAFPFSRGSSQPRDQTQVSRIAGRFFTGEPPGKPEQYQSWSSYEHRFWNQNAGIWKMNLYICVFVCVCICKIFNSESENLWRHFKIIQIAKKSPGI